MRDKFLRKLLPASVVAVLFFVYSYSVAAANVASCSANGLFARRYDDSELMLSLSENSRQIRGTFIAYGWVSDVDSKLTIMQKSRITGSRADNSIALSVGDPIDGHIAHHINGRIVCRVEKGRTQVDFLFHGKGRERDVWFVKLGDTSELKNEVNSLKVYLYGSDPKFEASVQKRIKLEPSLRKRLEDRRIAATGRPAAVLDSISSSTTRDTP